MNISLTERALMVNCMEPSNRGSVNGKLHRTDSGTNGGEEPSEVKRGNARTRRGDRAEAALK